MATCGCNIVFADGSVRALAPDGRIPLAAVALGLRRAGARARAFGLGVQVPMLQAVLSGLRGQGVAIGSLSLQPAGGPMAVLMVSPDHDGMSRPGSGVLFLAAAGGTPTPLLLPAVQNAREAARRLEPGTRFETVLVQHEPGAGPTLAYDQLALNFTLIRPD